MIAIRFCLIFVLFFSAYGAKKEYEPCFLKNRHIIFEVDKVNCIAVDKTRLLCHDPLLKIKSKQIIKFDPFFRLYELKTDIPPKEIVKFKSSKKYHIKNTTALIDKDGYELSLINSFNNAFKLGKVNKKSYNKVLGSKCYGIIGVGSINNSFISSEILINFLSKKNIVYGDVGIRIKELKNHFFVSKRDIYFKNNPFEVGDEILAINKKQYKRIDFLTNKILFSKQNEELVFDILRNKKKKKLKVKVGKRYGGGFVVDSFLERFGVYLNKDLTINKITKHSLAYKYGLRKGDKLLWFDRQKENKINQITDIISHKKERETTLLFERNGFEFFWRIY